MWSSTFSPALGRHSSYPASSGPVQAASSLMITADFMWILLSTSRSFDASHTASDRKLEAR